LVRLAIDLGAVVLAFAMVARLRGIVTPFALRFGVLASTAHAAGQVAMYFSPLRSPGAGHPDLGAAAVVIGVTALTLGRWERLVADEHLIDPSSGRNDLHGRMVWVVVPVLVFGFLFDWAAR
jgi:hypothetical protein